MTAALAAAAGAAAVICGALFQCAPAIYAGLAVIGAGAVAVDAEGVYKDRKKV